MNSSYFFSSSKLLLLLLVVLLLLLLSLWWFIAIVILLLVCFANCAAYAEFRADTLTLFPKVIFQTTQVMFSWAVIKSLDCVTHAWAQPRRWLGGCFGASLLRDTGSSDPFWSAAVAVWQLLRRRMRGPRRCQNGEVRKIFSFLLSHPSQPVHLDLAH